MHSVSLAALAASWERWQARQHGAGQAGVIMAVCATELAMLLEAPDWLAAAKARHQRRQPPPDSGAAHCTADGQDWPCDFTQLAALIWGEPGELPHRAGDGDGGSDYQHPCPGCGDLVAIGEEIAHATDCGTAPWPDGYRWCGRQPCAGGIHMFTVAPSPAVWTCPGYPLWRLARPVRRPGPRLPHLLRHRPGTRSRG